MVLKILIIGLLIIVFFNIKLNTSVFLSDISLYIGIKGFKLRIKAKEKSTPSNKK
ncbi:hypothetical protein J2Z44_003631 [Clostridium punense]|uniref:Uncharacterized protein n=2 Tax=Clostridium punense TaxID=1054297 RepID=A0ABS4K7L1_9CLOT|nr:MULTISPECIES: hypothetical protein [Clostridium]MBP2023789.1 hypothetical protein [Clostridium punense]